MQNFAYKLALNSLIRLRASPVSALGMVQKTFRCPSTYCEIGKRCFQSGSPCFCGRTKSLRPGARSIPMSRQTNSETPTYSESQPRLR
jgi:hypothetical protein